MPPPQQPHQPHVPRPQVKSSDDDPNGSHVALRVISTAFEGKNRVQRQQLVYKAIWEELQGPIHAVDELVCRTPAEEGM